MRKGKRIALIIPALNEEAALPYVLSQIPDWVDRVIVVDNGSSDGTARVARSYKAEVISESRRGYGWAMRAGIKAADDCPILLFCDGDHADDLTQATALVDPIVQGDADFTLASRSGGQAEAGALTLVQRWGNWLACRLIDLLWGYRYTDLGPFRAIRRPALMDMTMTQMTYGWTVEMQIKALKQGLRVMEVPARYRVRIGTSKVSGTLRGSIGAGYGILRVIALEALPR